MNVAKFQSCLTGLSPEVELIQAELLFLSPRRCGQNDCVRACYAASVDLQSFLFQLRCIMEWSSPAAQAS